MHKCYVQNPMLHIYRYKLHMHSIGNKEGCSMLRDLVLNQAEVGPIRHMHDYCVGDLTT